MKYLLIVDDDSDLREGLAAVLSDSALAAYTAADIASARRMLDATAFDLVLLDCNLPDGSGIDFCHELTSARDIAVVFLTIRDSELDEVTALRAGACDYLRKPFSLSVLRERINAALPPRLRLLYVRGRALPLRLCGAQLRGRLAAGCRSARPSRSCSLCSVRIKDDCSTARR